MLVETGRRILGGNPGLELCAQGPLTFSNFSAFYMPPLIT